MVKYYTGIGSRKCPESFKDGMARIASFLEDSGYILRSGAAVGADSYFESGVKNPANKEIYIPWKNFNGSDSTRDLLPYKAVEIAMKFHPAWGRLTNNAKKLMARNTMQVLGEDCNTPSSFVLCWTPNGKEIGGTSQALRIAKHYNIPIINWGTVEEPNLLLEQEYLFLQKHRRGL